MKRSTRVDLKMIHLALTDRLCLEKGNGYNSDDLAGLVSEVMTEHKRVSHASYDELLQLARASFTAKGW